MKSRNSVGNLVMKKRWDKGNLDYSWSGPYEVVEVAANSCMIKDSEREPMKVRWEHLKPYTGDRQHSHLGENEDEAMGSGSIRLMIGVPNHSNTVSYLGKDIYPVSNSRAVIEHQSQMLLGGGLHCMSEHSRWSIPSSLANRAINSRLLEA